MDDNYGWYWWFVGILQHSKKPSKHVLSCSFDCLVILLVSTDRRGRSRFKRLQPGFLCVCQFMQGFFGSQKNRHAHVETESDHPATKIGFLGIKVGFSNVSNFAFARLFVSQLSGKIGHWFLDTGDVGIQLSQIGMQSHCIDGTGGSCNWRLWCDQKFWHEQNLVHLPSADGA